MRVNTKWVKGKSAQEVVDIKSALAASAEGFERLSEMLQELLDDSVGQMANRQNYESPAFPEKMADRLGEQRALRRVLDLINFEE